MAPRPEDLQATFCATIVDEWARDGVSHAVVCPGSRSTPLALALAAADLIELHVHHDERSAGFLAIGLALGTAEPAVVLTTSGTAAVELHPAVVEADLAGVPLLVCTADRPPELIDVGAPQAIDQMHLFGRSVRWFHAPGVADPAAQPAWRAMAARAYAEATAPAPGPVHLNLAFREPLVGQALDLPPGRGGDGAWSWRPPAAAITAPAVGLAEDLAGRRGVIVAGHESGSAEVVSSVAAALGWPVLASPQADVWGASEVVPCADAILRTRPDLRPEVVLRLGAPLASRVVSEWLASSGAAEIVAAGDRRWSDPHGTAAVLFPHAASDLLDAWSGELSAIEPADEGQWRARWQALGERAAGAVADTLASEPELTEPAIARSLVDALPPEARLVVSSSMPIRDLEWFAEPGGPVEVLANRGANGIDGVVSTAVGTGLADPTRPAVLLVGDLAFLHDSNGLLGAPGRELNLTIVVVDNDGGGIFSFLPQATAVEASVFERILGTPHGIDLVALAASYGVEARAASEVPQSFAADGIEVVVLGTDRRANVDVHRRLNDAVARALAAEGWSGGAPANA